MAEPVKSNLNNVAAADASPAPVLPAVVSCVEAGGLEDQTVRMVRSLRAHAGRFSNAPVHVIKARPGPPLSRTTRAAFDALSVAYSDISRSPSRSRESWNHFMNKPYALQHVARTESASQILWLDSDILLCAEPELLLHDQHHDISACPVDSIGATQGETDPMHAYWRTLCDGLSLDLAQLPRIRTAGDNVEIPLYFNSGVFCFRTGSGFAANYLKTCRDILDLRIRSKVTGIYFTDQHALGLTIQRTGIRWRALPIAYNYPLGSASFSQRGAAEALKSACILHYHNSLWPEHWQDFCRLVDPAHPHLRDIVVAAGPLKSATSATRKITIRLMKELRRWQFRQFESKCVTV
jgi:hypothetical protein